MKRLAVAVAVAGLMLVLPGVSADAGVVITLSGTAACDSVTGDHAITWTLDNPTVPENIGAVAAVATPAEASLATSSFSPNPIPQNGSSTALSTLDGTYVGSVQIDVTLAGPTYDGAILQAGVELPSPCPQPPTTTTTSTTTTTVPETTTTAAAQPAAAQPTFTG